MNVYFNLKNCILNFTCIWSKSSVKKYYRSIRDFKKLLISNEDFGSNMGDH